MLQNTADFDISTIVYIVIAIVAFVSSILQKKKAKQEAEPETETKKTDWRDLFDIPEAEDQQEEKSFVPEAPKPETSVQPVFVSKNEFIKAGSTESYEANEAHFKSLRIQQNDFVDVIKQSEITGVSDKEEKMRFEMDIEKAIIYSEILQRKY